MTRAADILLAAAALLISAPLLALAALLVRVGLGRPILFRQARSGLHGESFEMLKLRSMSDARDGRGVLLPDAQRLTALGRILRRSRVDELPGLLSVLRGDMALVGPRPLLPATIAAMGEAGVRRGAVRPGLTGWAQVNGNALLTNEAKLALDLWYIANRSHALDLAILLRTVGVVLGGEQVNSTNLEKAVAGNPRRSR